MNQGSNVSLRESNYGLEAHLKEYAKLPEYELLYSSWLVDKEACCKQLEAVAVNYPHYSRHDATHSKQILAAIELFLGDNRIRELSASDTWLLLQAAYSHDIGMSLSAEELVKKMRGDTDFRKDLKESCLHDSDAWAAYQFIEPLLNDYGQSEKWPYGGFFVNESDKLNDITISRWMDERQKYLLFKGEPTRWPSEFKDKFTLVLETYARKQHGEYSESVLTQEAYDACGSKKEHIPLRMRLLVAKISSMHMQDRAGILAFPQEDLGICNDYVHPRFAMIMLRIGDLLDMDNGRFNQTQLDVMGRQGEASLIHTFKHEAVTHFLIQPLEISVKADFRTEFAGQLLARKTGSEARKEKTSHSSVCNGMRNQEYSEEEKNEIYKQHQKESVSIDSEQRTLCMNACMQLFEWLKMLENELEFFSKHWLDIVPRKFPGTVPYYRRPELKIGGNLVQEDELQLRYEIATDRASEIIEGAGLYQNPHSVFLREILQNALDATKLQIYRDVLSGMHPGFALSDNSTNDNSDNSTNDNKEALKKLTPFCFFERLMPAMQQYRIETWIGIDPTDDKQLQVRIRDHGTGISYEALKGMRNIGAIVHTKNEEEERREMPEWLIPTGHFGIGLQSIFYVAKSFKICSRARHEPNYGVKPPLREMTFYSTRLGGNIDVRLCSDKGADAFGFGTEVIITIPLRDAEDLSPFFKEPGEQFDAQKSDIWGGQLYDAFTDNFDVLVQKFQEDLNTCFLSQIFILEKQQKNSDRNEKPICEDGDQQNTLQLPPVFKQDRFPGDDFLRGSFGEFCVLLDHHKIKQSTEDPMQVPNPFFSVWSDTYQILLKFKHRERLDYAFDEGELKFYYKNILVPKTKGLTCALRIPHWDVEVHIMSKHAGNLLRINREDFLPEKTQQIVQAIQDMHIQLLKDLFLLEGTKKGLEEAKKALKEKKATNEEIKKIEKKIEKIDFILQTVWQSRTDEQDRASPVFLRLREYYLTARLRSAYYIWQYSGETSDDALTALCDELPTGLIRQDCISCYALGGNVYRHVNMKSMMKYGPVETLIRNETKRSLLWFCPPYACSHNDISLTRDMKTPSDQVRLLCADEMYHYQQFSIRRFIALELSGCDEVLPIYQPVKRSGEIVQSVEDDYWLYARHVYRETAKSCEAYQQKYKKYPMVRMVLPSKKGFELISVTRLPAGLEESEIAKFDSYIILPFEFALLVEVVENQKNIKDPLAQYLTNKWGRNERLTAFIAQYSVANKDKSAEKRREYLQARKKDEQEAILQQYCIFMRQFIKRIAEQH